MSETPVPPLASPSKEVATTPTTPTTTTSNAKKFEGDGVVFKGKLIGMEDLSIDRDEKICLDSMFKLKAVVRARGEHKQKIQINLNMSAVKIIDEITKAQVASHEIERISFVVVDPRDTRAFGYIFNTADDRHQFWAIKTERAAAATVVSLKELFELAFEQFTNAEKAKLETNKPTTTTTTTTTTTVPAPSPTVSSEPSSTIVDSSPLPPPPPPPPTPVIPTPVAPTPVAPTPVAPTPVAPTPVLPTVIATENPSLIDGDLWGASTPTTITQTTGPVEVDLWDINAPSEPILLPTPKVIDPLEEIFGGLSTTQPPPPSTNNTNFLFDLIPNTAPPPAPVNHYPNFAFPTTDVHHLNTSSTLPQQQSPFTTKAVPSAPPPSQQRDLLVPTSLSSVTAPISTNPFAGFDILGGLPSGSTTKPTKESFFPAPPPPKTIQQLQMEKQRNPFARS